jgi:hypothetical protein
MPSITCTCGQRISIGSFPTAAAYRALSEVDYDELDDALEANDKLTELERLLFSSTRIYRCSQCSELIVFWKDRNEPEFFKKN